MYRNEEYWNTCSLLATHGFLCMLTMELTGQFAQGIDEAAAEGLARRGLAMWRTLYQRENEDPSSNFYQRVCPRACASGYSLGGGSVQSVAYFADAEDGIECIAPIHAGVSMPWKVNTIEIPTLIGSSSADTVTPVGPIGAMFKYARMRPPVVQVRRNFACVPAV